MIGGKWHDSVEKVLGTVVSIHSTGSTTLKDDWSHIFISDYDNSDKFKNLLLQPHMQKSHTVPVLLELWWESFSNRTAKNESLSRESSELDEVFRNEICIFRIYIQFLPPWTEIFQLFNSESSLVIAIILVRIQK